MFRGTGKGKKKECDKYKYHQAGTDGQRDSGTAGQRRRGKDSRVTRTERRIKVAVG